MRDFNQRIQQRLERLRGYNRQTQGEAIRAEEKALLEERKQLQDYLRDNPYSLWRDYVLGGLQVANNCVWPILMLGGYGVGMTSIGLMYTGKDKNNEYAGWMFVGGFGASFVGIIGCCARGPFGDVIKGKRDAMEEGRMVYQSLSAINGYIKEFRVEVEDKGEMVPLEDKGGKEGESSLPDATVRDVEGGRVGEGEQELEDGEQTPLFARRQNNIREKEGELSPPPGEQSPSPQGRVAIPVRGVRGGGKWTQGEVAKRTLSPLSRPGEGAVSPH